MNPAKFFLENHKFTMVLTVLVLVFGLNGMRKLNSESYPSVDFATATVETRYPGASAEEIESRITKPIEDEIRGVSGLKDIRSISQTGKSTITIRADIDNVDVTEVMSDLQRAVDRVADLPQDLGERPRFLELKSEEFPIIELAIVGPNEDRRRDILADDLKESIEDHKSVLSVRLTGFQKRQFRVNLDPELLKKYHMGIDEVMAKISARNVNIPAGKLKGANSQSILRLEGKITDAKNLEQIVLRSNFSQRKVLLKDVGQVVDEEEDARAITLHNGLPATLVTVTKKAGADTISLVDDVNSTIDQFIQKHPNYTFEIYTNEGLKVKNRLDVLSSNALSGLALVVIFLLIFLPGKTGMMASMSLPLAVLATFGFMPIFGMNLNAITVLALVIALGMLVDNSVVISENYVRLINEGYSPKKAALTSIGKLWLPITATALTTIAAFLPMLVTRGIMGQFIMWIPVVVTIALVASLLESFFFLPMRLVPKKDPAESDRGPMAESKPDWFQRVFLTKFEYFMRIVVRYRYITAAGFMGIIAGSFYMMFVANQFILFPPEQTETYIARVELARGTPLSKTADSLKQLSQSINQVEGEHIDSIVATAGVSKLGPNDAQAKSGDNVGFLRISVDEETKNNTPHTTFLEALGEIDVPEGVQVTYETITNGPPVGKAVNATIRSHNAESLKKAADFIADRIRQTEGITNVAIDDVLGEDMVYIEVNEARASRLGLSTGQIGDVFRSAISGTTVSEVNLDNTTVDIVVQFNRQSRERLVDLNDIHIRDLRGNLIPVSSVAKFTKRAGKPQIKRFDFKRSKTLTADVGAGMTPVKANKILQLAFSEAQKSYGDISIVFGGEGESTKESMDSLWEALSISLIGIFAILVFLFKSYFRPMIIMSTIPLGLIGTAVAFFIHQKPISFLALIGVIGLGGIIVNSGIVLISFIDELRKDGEAKDSLNEVLVRASSLRLRAVVVSSLTTISGLLPTAYGIGGSDAILIPMTLAMAWGLTSGTLLTLVWVPCAYGILEDASNLLAKMTLSRKSAKEVNEYPNEIVGNFEEA